MLPIVKSAVHVSTTSSVSEVNVLTPIQLGQQQPHELGKESPNSYLNLINKVDGAIENDD